MSDIWFTSDTHFGHARIIEYCKRPFSSVDEMDEGLIKAWNDAVKPGDKIYHLGDFAFHKPERSLAILSRLNGEKFLVRGNHDSDHALEHYGYLFSWVKDYYRLNVGKRKIILCHFPFLAWESSHHGSWHLHGHSHGGLPDDPQIRRIDVGVDCHDQKPVSLEQITAIMAKKQPKDQSKRK